MVRKLLKWLTVMMGLFLLAFGIFLFTFDINQYRNGVQTVASRALNRNVELVGEMSMGISLIPTIVARDVRITNPDWASRPYFATIEKMELQVELLPLLQKEFRITQLLLEQADILLESDPQGNNNWTFIKKDKQKKAASFGGINRVNINQSKLEYRRANGTQELILIQNADAALKADLPVDLVLKGEFRGQPVNLELKGNRLGDLTALQKPWPFTAIAHVEDASLTIKGTVETVEQANIINADIVMQGEDSKTLKPLLGMALPEFGPYQIIMNLHARDDMLHASDVRMEMVLPFAERRLRIADGSAELGPHTRLQASLSGDYADLPIDLNLTGGTLQEIFSTTASWPLTGTLIATQNRIDVDGFVTGLLDANRVDLQLVMKGENPGPLEPLLGITLPDTGEYHIKTGLSGGDRLYVANISDAKVGSSDVRGRLSFDIREGPLRISADLTSNVLSIDDFSDRKKILPEKSAMDSWLAQSLLWAMPHELDVAFQLKAGGIHDLPILIKDINIQGRLLKGRLAVSNIAASIPAGRVTGSFDVLPGDKFTQVGLQLSSKQLDAGKLAQHHKSRQTVKGNMKGVTLTLDGKGARLDELLQQASVIVKAGDTDLLIIRETDDYPLHLTDFNARSEAGKPVHLAAQGSIRKVPVAFDITTDPLLSTLKGKKPLSMQVTASVADNTLLATGSVETLTLDKGFKFDVELNGQQLESLEPVFKTDLLKIGPYSFKGQLTGSNGKYTVTSLAGQINKTDIKGRISVSTTNQRPFVTAGLQSDTLHYHDIFARKQDPQQQENRVYVIPDIKLPDKLLRSVDASLDINTRQLFVGDVEYTDFNMQAELSDGKLNVMPIKASLNGGNIDGMLKVVLTDDTPVVFLELQGTNIDYGELLETLSMTDRTNGKADVFISISGQGADTRALLAKANGTIHMVSEKGKINQSKLDLWAADLITTGLTKAWKIENVTNVNCIVARADIIDGIAKSDSLLMDTELITVAGSGSINFATEELNILVSPAPKSPSFVSLAKPVRLTGTLSKPIVAAEKFSRAWSLGGILAGLANPGTLLLMYGNLGTLEANPCLEALKQRELTEQQAQQEGRREPKRLPGKILEFIRSPLDAVKSPTK